MPSVIMIAYHFPPEGNAGSYRPLRFARHLSRFGWQPVVLSQATGQYERYDPGLLALVPPEIPISRIRNADVWRAFQARRARRISQKLAASSPETILGIQDAHAAPFRSLVRQTIRTIEACCYHPDTAMGWIRPAVKETVKLCARFRANVIWATAGPVSSFVVAQRAAQKTGIPYVLDFRDAWTIIPTEFDACRPNWAQRLDRCRMFELLKHAQAIVFRYTTEAECYWRVYKGALDKSRIHIIPNGYEGTIDEWSVSTGDKCNVLYAGTLCDYRYDTLLRALRLLKDSSPEVLAQLNFRFVGEGACALGEQAAHCGLADTIMVSGPVTHAEVDHLSRQAHALLILGRPRKMTGYELFAAAKLFGYLRAGRPIIGIVPHDETRRILLSLGVSTVADVDTISDITRLLRELVAAWKAGNLGKWVPDRDRCETYSAERQTEQLVSALEGMPPSRRFIAGECEIPASLQRIDEKLCQPVRRQSCAANPVQ